MMKNFTIADGMVKVVLLGGDVAGKTNILYRMIQNRYDQSFHTTIGVEYMNKEIVLDDKSILKLQIWDTAGQERYRYI